MLVVSLDWAEDVVTMKRKRDKKKTCSVCLRVDVFFAYYYVFERSCSVPIYQVRTKQAFNRFLTFSEFRFSRCLMLFFIVFK